jgi:ketosteroid isomerase-like protein
MASENVELVRSIYAAWKRGDFSSSEWAHPEIEFTINDELAQGTWKGPVGMAEGFRGWLSAWEGFRVDADEYREINEEHVLVLSHFSGRGKTSGMALGQMRAGGAEVFQLRGGKVTRLAIYADPERAFADLGLSG